MRKNVLISTTRQWNPGDEFIMLGCLNILKEIYGDNINPIIFNRNPDIRVGGRYRNKTKYKKATINWDKKNIRGKAIIQNIFNIGQYDNSYKDDMDSNNIDIALFAGSPEWYGSRLNSMYEAIEKSNIPTIFLGLGAGDSTSFEMSKPVVKSVLSKSNVITTRDLATAELLKDYGGIYVPCPALLASKNIRVVENVKKIGLIYATNETLQGNNVSKELHDYICVLYKKITEQYNVGLVCHYIDEIEQAHEEFPNLEIYYSYDAKDYIDIYNNFDLVIGGRVHGIGMSASLGIPGIMINHDSRSSTTDGFLAQKINIGTSVDDVINMIKDISHNKIKEYSQNLNIHKEHVKQKYIEIIKSSMIENNSLME